MADPGEGSGGPDPPAPTPRFQGSLLPMVHVGENPGNEVVYEDWNSYIDKIIYNTF